MKSNKLDLVIKRALHKSGCLWALLAACMVTSCAGDSVSDDPEFVEGIPVEVAFTLSSRYNGSTTRTDGIPTDPTDDNEKINDWFLVFADKENVIRKVLNRTDVETGLTGSNNAAVEEETFRCILPTGTYSVYAFANMSKDVLKDATAKDGGAGITFTIGEKIPADIDKAAWQNSGNAKDLNLWDITSGAIPMTGFLKNIKVRNSIEEKFSIEVVRMTAKIELRFINPGEGNITVNKIDFTPVTESAVSLFPRSNGALSYSHLGNYSFTPLENAEYKTLEFTPTPAIAVPAGNNASDKVGNAIFYAKESISKIGDADGPFTVSLNLTYADNSIQTLRFKPTKNITGYINRNDWVVIPVKLSQYVVETQGLFYPPIGGYPAMIQTTDDEGSDVYTLGTQGEFSIFPELIDQLSRNKMPVERYTMAMNIDSESNNLFVTPLKINKLPGSERVWEITGEAGTNTGSAEITLTVSLYDSGDHTGDPKSTYTHKIKIERAN
ncbi:MAG: hypothetical protein HDS35_06250 [Bacteroides sp.]|nr:hypothetical protein [Bacteroides sp.]